MWLDEGADATGCSDHTHCIAQWVSHWNIAMATVLLEVHANVNAIDDGCRAPLHSAVYTNNMDVIELLR